jgi:hypothetical protein
MTAAQYDFSMSASVIKVQTYSDGSTQSLWQAVGGT